MLSSNALGEEGARAATVPIVEIEERSLELVLGDLADDHATVGGLGGTLVLDRGGGLEADHDLGAAQRHVSSRPGRAWTIVGAVLVPDLTFVDACHAVFDDDHEGTEIVGSPLGIFVLEGVNPPSSQIFQRQFAQDAPRSDEFVGLFQ